MGLTLSSTLSFPPRQATDDATFYYFGSLPSHSAGDVCVLFHLGEAQARRLTTRRQGIGCTNYAETHRSLKTQNCEPFFFIWLASKPISARNITLVFAFSVFAGFGVAGTGRGSGISIRMWGPRRFRGRAPPPPPPPSR